VLELLILEVLSLRPGLEFLNIEQKSHGWEIDEKDHKSFNISYYNFLSFWYNVVLAPIKKPIYTKKNSYRMAVAHCRS